MSFDKNEEMLKDMLEKIIFDESKLEVLKEMISKLEHGLLPAKKLREEIIFHREEIFKELLDFFPFYVEHLLKSKSIDEFASETIKNISSKDLNDRESLLIEVYDRLIKIQEKLTNT
ncbi:MAG: hypothetical protein ACFFBP_18160 [Promethearchaeota archaeon]